MLMLGLILVLSVFFAMNMGGANIAGSFAAAYGSRLISRPKAALLFGIFVMLGAIFLGDAVTATLGKRLMPSSLIGYRELVVILFSASSSLFVANLLKVPQSTSYVTVAAIAGVGLYHGQLNTGTIYWMLPFWFILPLMAFGLTYVIGALVYPPSKKNFWIYEKFVNQRDRLRKFVIVSSCYNAFSVGTNNVANVVGPLLAAGLVAEAPGLIVFGILFAAGGMIFTGPMTTAGHKIVPLGLVSASIMGFVCGSLMIAASIWGVPQSFVVLKMSSLFAISSLKRGKLNTFNDPATRLTLINWTVNPLITVIVSYALCWIWIK